MATLVERIETSIDNIHKMMEAQFKVLQSASNNETYVYSTAKSIFCSTRKLTFLTECLEKLKKGDLKEKDDSLVIGYLKIFIPVVWEDWNKFAKKSDKHVVLFIDCVGEYNIEESEYIVLDTSKHDILEIELKVSSLCPDTILKANIWTTRVSSADVKKIMSAKNKTFEQISNIFNFKLYGTLNLDSMEICDKTVVRILENVNSYLYLNQILELSNVIGCSLIIAPNNFKLIEYNQTVKLNNSEKKLHYNFYNGKVVFCEDIYTKDIVQKCTINMRELKKAQVLEDKVDCVLLSDSKKTFELEFKNGAEAAHFLNQLVNFHKAFKVWGKKLSSSGNSRILENLKNIKSLPGVYFDYIEAPNSGYNNYQRRFSFGQRKK